MRRAIELAKEGDGFTSPNPLVGAVAVLDGEIVAEGWHKKAGGPHAEIEVINLLGVDASKCDLYVTLEPCAHIGRTGPCAEAVSSAGFKKVYVGMLDPFPAVNGLGIEFLRSKGLEVELCADIGLIRNLRMLNQPFLKYVETALPYVVLKAGMSLDGRTATASGDSQWITSKEARDDARFERSRADAVLVGTGTVLADDCTLAAHGIYAGKNLLRVVVGHSDVLLDPGLKIFRDENVLVETSAPGEDLDLLVLLKKLAARGVRTLFVEGGASIHGSFVDAGLVDKVIFYLAPKLLGGKSLSVIGGRGATSLDDCLEFSEMEALKVGQDLKVTAFARIY